MPTRRMSFGTLLLFAFSTKTLLASYGDPMVLSHDITDPYGIDNYHDHPCKRPCKKDSKPLTCRYYFRSEHYAAMSAACYGCPKNQTDCFLPQCVPADGRTRGVLVVNRMMPGPLIDVCKGDTIEVLVDNQMQLGEGTSIHWHGILQKGTPHMDGVSMVTQCPIHPYSTMTYRFKAEDPGTHFWHSHSSLQRAEGFFGGLVVRVPNKLDPHRHLYDYDLPEHYILLNEWDGRTTGEAFPLDLHRGLPSVPTSILVNGLGTSVNGPAMPFPVFRVQAGKRYRFRFAYNGIYNCPVYVTVDGHTLLMIASDGRDFEPVEVDGFVILSGERYDFVLNTKRKVQENFWIRFKGRQRCEARSVFQAAILSYEGTGDKQPEGTVTYNNTDDSENRRILNGLSGDSTSTCIQIADLKLVAPDDDPDILTRKPDQQVYISAAASRLVDDRFKPPPQQNISTEKPRRIRPNNHLLNYISSYLPPSPPLTQFEDIPKELFCNNKTVTDDCTQVMCLCVHRLTFNKGDIVEIVLVSFTKTLVHPMHIHGHTARVVTMKSFQRDLTVAEIKSLDKKGKIPRITTLAPYKDTIPTHPQAVTIIRFRINNPGFWFFHCHIEFHAELGMALIVQAGQPHEMPKPPKGFPTCGSWRAGHKNRVPINKEQPAADAETSNGRNTTTLSVAIGLTGAFVTVLIVLTVVVRRRCRERRGVMYQPVKNEDGVSYNSFS